MCDFGCFGTNQPYSFKEKLYGVIMSGCATEQIRDCRLPVSAIVPGKGKSKIDDISSSTQIGEAREGSSGGFIDNISHGGFRDRVPVSFTNLSHPLEPLFGTGQPATQGVGTLPFGHPRTFTSSLQCEAEEGSSGCFSDNISHGATTGSDTCSTSGSPPLHSTAACEYNFEDEENELQHCSLQEKLDNDLKELDKRLEQKEVIYGFGRVQRLNGALQKTYFPHLKKERCFYIRL